MKKKILIIASGLPRPVKGGTALRFERLFTVLSKEYDLYMAVRFKSDDEVKNIVLNKDIFKEIFYIKSARPNFLKKIGITIKSLLKGIPPQAYSMYFKELSEEVKSFLNKEEIYAIHYDHVEYGYYFKDLKNYNCQHVLVVDDIVSDKYYEEYLITTNPIKKIYSYITYHLYNGYEKNIIKKFNNIITVSKENYKRISMINNCNIGIIKNGGDISDNNINKKINKNINEVKIMFLGSLDYEPNNFAVLYFIEQVIPILNKQNVNYKLYVVGNNASEKIKSYESDNIIITGFVEDLDEYYNLCDLMVVPIFSGGGTRTKILESMGKHTVVISTTKGCEGIDVVDGESILIANTADEFMEKIILCRDNSFKKREIEENAYNLAKENYDWKKIGRELVDYYDDILETN